MMAAAFQASALSGSSPATTRTAVRILRGRYRGRVGWIKGTLADRRARGIGKALARIEGEPPELLALASMAEVTQLALPLEGKVERAPERKTGEYP